MAENSDIKFQLSNFHKSWQADLRLALLLSREKLDTRINNGDLLREPMLSALRSMLKARLDAGQALLTELDAIAAIEALKPKPRRAVDFRRAHALRVEHRHLRGQNGYDYWEGEYELLSAWLRDQHGMEVDISCQHCFYID